MCHWTALYVVVQGSTHIKIYVKICVERKYQEYIHTYISEDCCFYPLYLENNYTEIQNQLTNSHKAIELI